MRRPKHKLQVDTFPFLAVLLCAMGSFILLLMMIDKRAKIAAHAKARDTYLARKLLAENERAERDAAAREKAAKLEAEWQGQKNAIHVALKTEEESLNREIAGLLAAMAKTEDEANERKSAANSLAKKVSLEDIALRQLQKELLARRDEFDKAKQLSQGHLKLREQMTRDLAVLELALRNVQARKAQQRPVYSLVPYKGKHGSSAKPIYIEVTEASVAVHPGPTTIAGFEWSSETLRRVIEERTGPLEKIEPRPGVPPDESRKNPYLLFLVRPSGIHRYYEALAFLNYYHVDFGYELIEPDWVFDFSPDKLDQQPWRNASRTEYEPANVTRPAPKGMGPRVLGNGGSSPTAMGRPGGIPSNGSDFEPGQGVPLVPLPGTIPAPVGRANVSGGNSGQPAAAASGSPGISSVPAVVMQNGGAVGSNPAYGSTGVALPPSATFPNSGAIGTPNGSGVPGGRAGGSPGGTFGNEVATPGMPRFPALGPGSGNIGIPQQPGAGSPGSTANRIGPPAIGMSPNGGVANGAPSLGPLTPIPGNSRGAANGGMNGSPITSNALGTPDVQNWTGVPTQGNSAPNGSAPFGNAAFGGAVTLPRPTLSAPNLAARIPAGAQGAAPGFNGGNSPGVPGDIAFAPGGNGVGRSIGDSSGNGVPGATGGPSGFGAGSAGGTVGTPKDSTFGSNLNPGSIGEQNPFAQPGATPGSGANGSAGGLAGGASGSPGVPGSNPPGTLPSNITMNFSDKQPEPSAPPRFGNAGPPSDKPLTFRPIETPPRKDDVAVTMDPDATSRPIGLRPNGSGVPAAGDGDPVPPSAQSPFLTNNEKPRAAVIRPPAIGRIIGNRDFILIVDCYENVVTLSPPGRSFNLTSAEAIEQLAKQIKILVDRRQQTVRPGEPPYRPIIQFRVQPDGRRAYYAVYPRLAEFGYAMTRENPD